MRHEAMLVHNEPDPGRDAHAGTEFIRSRPEAGRDRTFLPGMAAALPNRRVGMGAAVSRAEKVPVFITGL